MGKKKRAKLDKEPWDYHWSVNTSTIHSGLEFRVWRTRGGGDMFDMEHLDVDGEWHMTMPDATIPAAEVLLGKVAKYVQIGTGTDRTRRVLGFTHLKKSEAEMELRTKYDATKAVTEAMMHQMNDREWEVVMADMLKTRTRRRSGE